MVQNSSIPDVSHEAMEALLVLHQPEKIEMWNPEAPINTFWDLSSQVLFSMSQKLIQHLIVNYTDVLKWLRKILECRNQFLKKHSDYANVGSQIAICRQAHIKLEVVLFMYLWSIGNFLFDQTDFIYFCEIHKISISMKFTNSESQFTQNSQYQNLNRNINHKNSESQFLRNSKS